MCGVEQRVPPSAGRPSRWALAHILVLSVDKRVAVGLDCAILVNTCYRPIPKRLRYKSVIRGCTNGLFTLAAVPIG